MGAEAKLKLCSGLTKQDMKVLVEIRDSVVAEEQKNRGGSLSAHNSRACVHDSAPALAHVAWLISM